MAAEPLLLVNGRIYTVDPSFATVSVLAARDGRIVYAGDSEQQARALLPPRPQRRDLAGACVIPGLVDSHLHFQLQGRKLAELDLARKSKAEVLALVARSARELKQGEWILGLGWNNEEWPDTSWPRKEELDAVAPGHPVALTRCDAHSMWVNSHALHAAGIDRNSPDPQGGEILRQENGELLGILIDTAVFRIWEVLPPLTEAQALHACTLAERTLLSYGICSVGDAWQTVEDHERLKKACAAGQLRIRIYGMLGSEDHAGRPGFKAGMRPLRGLCDERLSLCAFKLVLDGSLGSRSAWLTREYADRPGHRGNGRYSDDALFDLLQEPVAQGFQICAHAIGDAAVLQAVRVFERLASRGLGIGLRHRIEHFQMAAPETVARALNLGIIPAMQTMHAVGDKAMAEARLSPPALADSYPWRQVIDKGAFFANGSDSPMEDPNPFHGMHAAVTRTPFAPFADQDPAGLRLSREEALRSYTIWAAGAELAQGVKGSLEAGKLADFLILDRDILRCTPKQLHDTRVLATVLGGEQV
ncbi:amidohydrolase, partial [Desulfovibrio sp. OttesenSCG-928-A18]|nr:amidohydrolase [Desulfovibrio sp. OttesenSCG-928-A18]